MKVKEWLEDRKKPKIFWTPELANDLLNFHSIDAGIELANLLSAEINKEMLKKISGKNFDDDEN